jgi:deazaflavin-dependent oxidoreductase (nitroreductase family)
MGTRPGVTRAALAPTRPIALIRRVAGPIWSLVGIVAVLEVPGRRTGTPRRVSVIPVKVDGASYLVSFGGVTDWARNLRAAGRGALRRKRRTQPFTAVEVEGDQRDRVIAAYLAGSGPVKKDFNRRPDLAEHPVFRMDATI